MEILYFEERNQAGDFILSAKGSAYYTGRTHSMSLEKWIRWGGVIAMVSGGLVADRGASLWSRRSWVILSKVQRSKTKFLSSSVTFLSAPLPASLSWLEVEGTVASIAPAMRSSDHGDTPWARCWDGRWEIRVERHRDKEAVRIRIGGNLLIYFDFKNKFV